MKKRIAIDMDEVMADFLQGLLDRYNDWFNDHITKNDLIGKRLWEVRPERGKVISSFVDEPNFFRDLRVIDGCQEVVRELNESYEVFIATAAMERPTSFKAKYDWLKEHFPFLSDSHFVFCGDKSIIHADYLIDDTPQQLNRFNGEGILYTAEHNKKETQFIRVNNWEDIHQLFLGKKSDRYALS